MTLQDFKKIKQILDKLLTQIENEALKDGEDISSIKFQQALRMILEKKLQELGISIEEYEQLEAELENKEIEDKKTAITLIDLEDVNKIRNEVSAMKFNTETDLNSFKQTVSEKLQDLEVKILAQIRDIVIRLNLINWDTLQGKPEILTRKYVFDEISNAIGKIKMPEIPEPIRYDDSKIIKDIGGIKEDVKKLKIKPVLQKSDLEKEVQPLKESISILSQSHNEMPDFRKLGMGLQGQIDTLIPSQSGNSGKYLTTNGSQVSWGTVAGGGDVMGPGTNSDGYIPLWDGADSKTLASGIANNSTHWNTAYGWGDHSGAGYLTAAITAETDPIVKAITGIIKSNGSAITAAIAGTDYLGMGGGNLTGALTATALHVTGNITDGSNTLTVANAKTAYDHSQDNTQAHSDYLLNSGNDVMAGVLTSNGLSTTGSIICGDHGAASAYSMVNALYGTTSASPIKASATTIGTIYVQYTA